MTYESPSVGINVLCTTRCVYLSFIAHESKHKRTLKRGRRCVKTHTIRRGGSLFCGEVVRIPVNILPGERYSVNSSCISGIWAPFPAYEMCSENNTRSP